MAVLDLPTYLATAEDHKQKIEEILDGFDTAECADDNPDEQARLEEFEQRYRDGLAAMDAFITATQGLINWGYPTFPSFDVPESMKEHLLVKDHNLGVVLGLLRGIAPAVSGTFGFGKPIEQPD